MADGEVFTAAPGQGLVVSTGILGDLVLPASTFDPGHADEIRDLTAQAAVYATQARGPGTLRAYRSAWRQYDAWCVRLGLPALSGDPRLVGMYLTYRNVADGAVSGGVDRHRQNSLSDCQAVVEVDPVQGSREWQAPIEREHQERWHALPGYRRPGPKCSGTWPSARQII
jgi:hypothetical protein